MSPGPEDFINQAEKRSILENDRKVRERGTTFSTFAEAFADEERGGRYAAVNKTNVIGTQVAPQYPEGPAWCADPTGVEPALGYSIDEAPVVGEPHEVERSLRELGEAGAFPTGAPDGGAAEAPLSEPQLNAEPAAPLSSANDAEPPEAA